MRNWELRTENLAERVLDKTTNNVVGKSDEGVQSVLQLNVDIMKVPNNKLMQDIPMCY